MLCVVTVMDSIRRETTPCGNITKNLYYIEFSDKSWDSSLENVSGKLWLCSFGGMQEKKVAVELIKSRSAQLICSCSWMGNIQSNCSPRVYRTHMLHSSVRLEHRGMPAKEWRPAEGVWGTRNHMNQRKKSEKRHRVECTAEWEEEWKKEREKRVHRECYSFSAGVFFFFNWINLLWKVLPGLMPCVHWRLGRRVGGWRGGLWGGCVMKQDLKRQIPPQAFNLSFQATLSPVYYSVWTYSSTHASNIKTQDTSA